MLVIFNYLNRFVLSRQRGGGLSLWVERPKGEFKHSNLPNVEIKKEWSYSSTLSYAFIARTMKTLLSFIFVRTDRK
jgi:hypothetical protein